MSPEKDFHHVSTVRTFLRKKRTSSNQASTVMPSNTPNE